MKKSVNKGHLSACERDKLTILHAQGFSLRKIASELGRHPSKNRFGSISSEAEIRAKTQTKIQKN